VIPPLTNSTALGTLVGNYYTIDVISEVSGCVCCCGDNHPLVYGHIHVDTPTP
jgi:hypothetical protein